MSSGPAGNIVMTSAVEVPAKATDAVALVILVLVLVLDEAVVVCTLALYAESIGAKDESTDASDADLIAAS